VNRPNRANADAVAAASAGVRIQMRSSRTANPQLEANGTLVADLAAGTTDDPLFGEAVGRDGRFQRPRRVERRISFECPTATGRQTLAAKRTTANVKSNLRITAISNTDDRLRTGPDAVIAAFATSQKLIFRNRPRRTPWRTAAAKIPSEQLPPGDRRLPQTAHDRSCRNCLTLMAPTPPQVKSMMSAMRVSLTPALRRAMETESAPETAFKVNIDIAPQPIDS